MSYPRTTFRPKPKLTVGKVFGGCLGLIALWLAIDSAFAAVLMLVMRGLHEYVHPAVPPVGFWGAFIIVVALSVLGTLLRGVGGSSK